MIKFCDLLILILLVLNSLLAAVECSGGCSFRNGEKTECYDKCRISNEGNDCNADQW